jgi:EAL domain-containing protein (putative c-di-GMP-specific phosphodiesterase class I)
LAELKALSCEYGQGNLFSKPVEALAAEKFMVDVLEPKSLSRPTEQALYRAV